MNAFECTSMPFLYLRPFACDCTQLQSDTDMQNLMYMKIPIPPPPPPPLSRRTSPQTNVKTNIVM